MRLYVAHRVCVCARRQRLLHLLTKNPRQRHRWTAYKYIIEYAPAAFFASLTRQMASGETTQVARDSCVRTTKTESNIYVCLFLPVPESVCEKLSEMNNMCARSPACVLLNSIQQRKKIQATSADEFKKNRTNASRMCCESDVREKEGKNSHTIPARHGEPKGSAGWGKLFQHLFDDMIDLLTHERVTSTCPFFRLAVFFISIIRFEFIFPAIETHTHRRSSGSVYILS